MRIGELSRRTGVSVRLLRYYEQQGLLMPMRRPSGYREYRDQDVERVRRIRLLLAAGLPTKTMGRALGGLCDEDGQLTPCTGLASDLLQERARIDETIRALLASRKILDQLIASTAQRLTGAGREAFVQVHVAERPVPWGSDFTSAPQLP